MSEQNHWDELAQQLGAEVKPSVESSEPKAAPGRAVSPPPKAKTKSATPPSRPADWSMLANSLGIEVPAEPAPPAVAVNSPVRREETFSRGSKEPSPPPRRTEPAWAEEIVEDVEVVEELDEIIPLDSELESEGGDESDDSRRQSTSGREQGERGERGERGDRPRRRRRRGRRGRSDRGGESTSEAGERSGSRPEGRSGEPRESSRGHRPRRDHDRQRHREQQPRGTGDEPTVPMDEEELLSSDRPERSPPAGDHLFSDEPARLAFDDLFEVDRARRERREAENRGESEHEETGWHKSERTGADAGDAWGSVEQENDSTDSDFPDREIQDIDDSDSDVEPRGESSRSQDEGEGRDKRRRRRRRRRRGGRERSSETASTEAGGDVSPDDREESPTDREPERMGDFNELDDADDDGVIDHHSHRGIPSWEEAIGFIIDTNMEGRSKSSKNGNSRGRRGGRGRSSKRDRDSQRPPS